MKREIKFRGLEIDSKQWVYGYYLIESDKPYIEVVGMSEMFNVFEVLPESVGEYTGLKDKNGVDIYEGDVVKSGISEQINVVKFIEGSFAMVHKHHSTCIRHFGMSECEIIGNIHQNPELL